MQNQTFCHLLGTLFGKYCLSNLIFAVSLFSRDNTVYNRVEGIVGGKPRTSALTQKKNYANLTTGTKVRGAQTKSKKT